jgi:hypothetical protein
MSITITAERLTSDRTRHAATPVDPADPYGRWVVSWLPDRTLTRNQAITAMTLAEEVAVITDDGQIVDHRHPMWPAIDAWAAELDLTGPRAMVLVSETAADMDPVHDAWMAANARSRSALQ